ncbi:MAG: hypothetical protein ACXVPQ_08715 [Bacteroidia bacterium]
MKKICSVVLALTVAFLIAACHKYPEDGHISFMRASKRLCKPTWHMKQLLIDGADSTDQTYSHPLAGNNVAAWKLKGSTLKFSEKTSKEDQNCVLGIYYDDTNSSGFTSRNVSWQLQSHDKEIASLHFFTSEFGGGTNWWYVFPETIGPWIIKKLTTSEFIIENVSATNKALRLVYQTQ